MFATNRQGAHFTLGSTFLFDEMESFRSSLTLPPPDREQRLRDPAVRDQMRREIADPSGRSFVFVWQVLRIESVVRPEHADLVDLSVTELAERWGADPLDAFLDLSLLEGLETQFVLAAPPDAKRLAATEEMIRSPFVMAGSSDGGAHLESFVGADFTTRLLTEWTPNVLSFEQAVSKLTLIPAQVHGLGDRGVIRPGAAADLCVIDRDRLAVGATHFVKDFPAGAGRFVVDAEGYVATIVNGRPLFRHGAWTGAVPGHVLRS
jgi:N-acyl-D-aspartate/D-glutamate deacylase